MVVQYASYHAFKPFQINSARKTLISYSSNMSIDHTEPPHIRLYLKRQKYREVYIVLSAIQMGDTFKMRDQDISISSCV